jgi:catechol 2,3-dioxygenase-like lactoylglutathione lyase family enzyme
MMTKIEHVNITVPDIDAAVAFLKIVAPDFEIRNDEKPLNDKRWMHIGNKEFYFALQESPLETEPKKPNQTYINYGFNHIGLVVHNIDDIEKQLIEAGYNKGIDTPKETFRKRIYYFDSAGFEWELVEYLSENMADRFLYE